MSKNSAGKAPVSHILRQRQAEAAVAAHREATVEQNWAKNLDGEARLVYKRS